MLNYSKVCEVIHNMKHFLLTFIILSLTAAFSTAEKYSRKEQIDQLYSIEYNLDTAENVIEIKIISTNSAPYDEAYGEECITQYLEEAKSDYGYYESSEVSRSKDTHYLDDYTMVRKIFQLTK